MTLSQLKAVCAAYHDKTAADLTVNSVDLFLVAANNVRRSAELRHNFELSRVSATLSIDGVEGGALSDAAITNAVGDTCTVTGTLSPAITGTYTRMAGVSVNGKAVFLKSSGTVGILFAYATGWALSASLTTLMADVLTGPSNSWTLTSTSVNPAGTYTLQGTNTGTPVITNSGTEDFASIKEVIAVQRTRPDGTLVPLDFTRADIPIERDRYELELSDDFWPAARYPSDAQILSRGSTSTVYQRGRKLFLYPADTTSTEDLEVTLECYALLNDYVAADLNDSTPSDFFVEFGAAFLQWSIILELNHYFHTFVPRQEGVLPPGSPQALAEQGWQDLLLWDSFMVDANSTRSR